MTLHHVKENRGNAVFLSLCVCLCLCVYRVNVRFHSLTDFFSSFIANLSPFSFFSHSFSIIYVFLIYFYFSFSCFFFFIYLEWKLFHFFQSISFFCVYHLFSFLRYASSQVGYVENLNNTREDGERGKKKQERKTEGK